MYGQIYINFGVKSKTTELNLSFFLEREANERSSFMHAREHVSTHYETRVKILNYKNFHKQSANRKNNISHHKYNRYTELSST